MIKKSKPSLLKGRLLTIVSFTTVIALSLLSSSPERNFPKDTSFTEADIFSAGKVAGAKAIAQPEIFQNISPPTVSALSSIAIDMTSDKVLFEKDPKISLPPASTTKIVTALVVMENYDLSILVSVPKECLGLPETPNVGFLEGELVSVENLLYGMLVKSASDASCALANIERDHSNFIAKMNKKAGDLGLINTHFTNEFGFDSAEDNHLSTASDLAILAREAMKNGVFRGIVMTRQVTIPSQIDPKRPYSVINTNELLFNLPGTTGVKTGNTEKAKGCLVYTYENLGKKILIVVMGSDERFKDTKKILDWILSSYNFPT